MKPKLVLHICCAPDEAWVVKKLHTEYDLCCFFCNPNIQPEEEYYKRLHEAKRAAEMFSVPFAADDYAPDSWEVAVADVIDSREGGSRCERCFLIRLRKTALFTKSIGWPVFTTVMSVSPHKRIGLLQKCGEEISAETGITYNHFDFKKNNGFLGSIQLSKELGLYRQDYCGCRLSKAEREEYTRKKANAQKKP